MDGQRDGEPCRAHMVRNVSKITLDCVSERGYLRLRQRRLFSNLGHGQRICYNASIGDPRMGHRFQQQCTKGLPQTWNESERATRPAVVSCLIIYPQNHVFWLHDAVWVTSAPYGTCPLVACRKRYAGSDAKSYGDMLESSYSFRVPIYSWREAVPMLGASDCHL